MFLNRCFYIWLLGVNVVKNELLLRIDSVCSSDVDYEGLMVIFFSLYLRLFVIEVVRRLFYNYEFVDKGDVNGFKKV